jgi:hypothetical protein
MRKTVVSADAKDKVIKKFTEKIQRLEANLTRCNAQLPAKKKRLGVACAHCHHLLKNPLFRWTTGDPKRPYRTVHKCPVKLCPAFEGDFSKCNHPSKAYYAGFFFFFFF